MRIQQMLSHNLNRFQVSFLLYYFYLYICKRTLTLDTEHTKENWLAYQKEGNWTMTQANETHGQYRGWNHLSSKRSSGSNGINPQESKEWKYLHQSVWKQHHRREWKYSLILHSSSLKFDWFRLSFVDTNL